jgi:hypothetical protein
VGHHFTLLPLRKSSNGFVVTHEYCDQFLETASKYVEGRHECIINGVGTIFFLRQGENDVFRQKFHIFSLYTSVRTNRPLTASNENFRHSANEQIDSILAAARALIPSARAISQEVTTRMQRTPLLLPLRHFGSKELYRLIDDIESQIKNQTDPQAYIHARCREFEQTFPFERSRRGGGRFQSPSGVDFAAPGRDLHGAPRRNVAGPHAALCHLTAVARLGGPIRSGFHYDCTKGSSAYIGSFPDCHSEIKKYTGKPHLNVYPNDFIRT